MDTVSLDAKIVGGVLKKQLEPLKKDVAEVDAKIRGIMTQLDTIESRVKDLNRQLDSIEAKVKA